MIGRHVDGIALRLEEVHVGHLSEQRREANVQLGVAQVHAQTAAAAFAEADEIPRERLAVRIIGLVAEPAVRVEGLAARENPLVVMLDEARHADGHARRDRVGAVLDRGIEYASESLRDPV